MDDDDILQSAQETDPWSRPLLHLAQRHDCTIKLRSIRRARFLREPPVRRAVAWGVLIFTSWRGPAVAAMGTSLDPHAVAFQVFTGLEVAVSVVIFVSYIMLLSFHAYLGSFGLSTYDFLFGERRRANRGKVDHGRMNLKKSIRGKEVLVASG
eukprot:CAMPEP_0185776946 /NCGR_PEP_ID=MMETSP1174-20130828/87713_1 /TAXON_ID=35687 /ORGANISM="Dictyocha speculum, Strain CCMP1381" /LENGTH=152 /DNA_ID=CAMNT_0028465129 /DNA_START=371 /DNA_END=826 /DNA_ORIENTATION=-